VAFPACSILGTVGPPPVSAGRHPPITRSLALSVYSYIFSNFSLATVISRDYPKRLFCQYSYMKKIVLVGSNKNAKSFIL
jgi:hypothetical protein